MAKSLGFARLENRKPARRRSEVSPEVLAALNAGKIATANLVEWLAIDFPLLARTVIEEIGGSGLAKKVGAAADLLRQAPLTQKIDGIGQAMAAALASSPKREQRLERLAQHPSDAVRIWGNYIAVGATKQSLAQRIAASRRFAVDDHFGVREYAWMVLRPFVAADLDQGIKRLLPWVRDSNPYLRRCAVECTRPRGVWCRHIDELKQNPAQALPLLSPVRADGNRYVQNSVANWLNDASKTQAAWVVEVCQSWRKESPTEETAYIVKRALRTLSKPTKKNAGRSPRPNE